MPALALSQSEVKSLLSKCVILKATFICCCNPWYDEVNFYLTLDSLGPWTSEILANERVLRCRSVVYHSFQCEPRTTSPGQLAYYGFKRLLFELQCGWSKDHRGNYLLNVCFDKDVRIMTIFSRLTHAFCSLLLQQPATRNNASSCTFHIDCLPLFPFGAIEFRGESEDTISISAN